MLQHTRLIFPAVENSTRALARTGRVEFPIMAMLGTRKPSGYLVRHAPPHRHVAVATAAARQPLVASAGLARSPSGTCCLTFTPTGFHWQAAAGRSPA
jgi:hypothetical protein